MAGAIDLFAGRSSLSGANLFKVNKSPLDQLDMGIEDVIGKQGQGAADEITNFIQVLVQAILGLGDFHLGDYNDVFSYFTNIENFLGGLNPLDPNFFDNIDDAAKQFITTILHPTDLLAMLVPLDQVGLPSLVKGFIPLENLALELIEGVIGGAQELIDAIMAVFGFTPGTATADNVNQVFENLQKFLASPDLSNIPMDPVAEIEKFITQMLNPSQYFGNLLSMLGLPDFTNPSFNPITAVEQFIIDMLHPTDLLAALVPHGSAGLPSIVTGHIPLENLALDLIGGSQEVIDGVENVLGNAQEVIDTIWNTLKGNYTGGNPTTGVPVEFLIEALQRIENDFVTGLDGLWSIGDTIEQTWHNLASGFVGEVGTVTGLSELLDLSYKMASNAGLGRYSWDILGVRNNRPMDQGLLATSGSNFGLSKVALQATAPTIPVTSGVSAIGFIRCEQSNDRGVLSWIGQGNANITACYVNIWQMNVGDPNDVAMQGTLPGDMKLVHRSPNLVSHLKSYMDWVVYQKPAAFLTLAGQVYGAEITVEGSGTHQVTGASTWIPNHPHVSVFPKTYAATRNSGTSAPAIGTVIPHASVIYSPNVPWFEWGVYVEGGVASYPDESFAFDTVGTGTIPIPDWANHVDVIALGAGAGGGGGGMYGVAQHNGGGSGQWKTATWAKGTDFDDATVVSVTVPAGGAPGATIGGGQTAGGNAVVSITGRTITASGGAVNWGQDNGQDAGHTGYNDILYVGGGSQHTNGGAGLAPGGGGASGPDLIGGSGGPGAPGAVWLVFRQT